MLFALCFGVWCCSMVAGMVVCLAYLMSGVVCKPFRFLLLRLAVRVWYALGVSGKTKRGSFPGLSFFVFF